MEIWKEVKGYEGLYLVSSKGVVYSFPKEWVPNKGVRKHEGKILKAGRNSKGYMIVVLTNKGESKCHLVHRLVVDAFYGITSEQMVDHINGVRYDNRIENLRICTRRENMNFDNVNIERRTKYRGVTYCKSKRKWQARIMIDKKKIYLGWYNSEEEAGKAYLNAIPNQTKF